MRRTITVSMDCDCNLLYGPLPEAVRYLQSVYETHPTAQLNEHWDGYESMSLQFSWERPESGEEEAARLAAELAEKERKRRQEKDEKARRERLKQYLRLKYEFG